MGVEDGVVLPTHPPNRGGKLQTRNDIIRHTGQACSGHPKRTYTQLTGGVQEAGGGAGVGGGVGVENGWVAAHGSAVPRVHPETGANCKT